MNKFLTVLGHTFWTRFKSKAFIISTVIMLAAVFLVSNIDVIIGWFTGDEETTEEVLVIDETGQFYPLFNEQLTSTEADVALVLFEGSEEEGKQAIQENDYEGLLRLDADEVNFIRATYYENEAAGSNIQMTLEQQLQQLKIALATESAGIDQEIIALIYNPVPFEKVALDESSKTDEELFATQGIIYIMLFVLYMFVIIYGQMISTDVATEKSSRVMEILISSASPVTHMFAKIFGIALLGISQLLILFVFTFGILRQKTSGFTAQFLEDFGFTSVPVSIYLYAFIFFVLGYFLYATIAAMLGSLVSRVEDVQQLTLPLIFLIMIAFFIAMFGLGAPEAKFITITSYIPFFTPMIMFLRVGMLEIPAWEIYLSFAILVVSIIFFSILGARIYRGGVLMYGPSRSLKDFRQALIMSKKEK